MRAVVQQMGLKTFAAALPVHLFAYNKRYESSSSSALVVCCGRCTLCTWVDGANLIGGTLLA